MRWLKHTLSVILVLVAAGIVAAIGFSDHSDDYGRLPVPGQARVHLPEGKVTVYYDVPGDAFGGNAGQVSFGLTPAGSSAPLGMAAPKGELSGTQVTRSETIGELGAIGKLDVPSAGDYLVTAETSLPPGASFLEFGTNAGAAVLNRWKLLAGLLLGALLLAVIPLPRSRRRWEDAVEPAWSSDPRAPYAG